MVAEDEIYLKLRGGSPVTDRIVEIRIMTVRDNFLIDKMLKRLAEGLASKVNPSSFNKVARNTDIK